MHIFFQEYMDRLQALHQGIHQALAGLPKEALDWIPLEGMNSFAVLVFHLTGAERYWIGDVALGQLSGRDREAEFRVSGLDGEALARRLDETLDWVRAALEPLQPADLEREGTSPRDGRRFTASWALLHALEHSGLHLGHIQIGRQLWDARR